MHAASDSKDNTYSDFRKEFALAWREGSGLPEVFRAAGAPWTAGDDAAIALAGRLLAEIGKYS